MAHRQGGKLEKVAAILWPSAGPALPARHTNNWLLCDELVLLLQ